MPSAPQFGEGTISSAQQVQTPWVRGPWQSAQEDRNRVCWNDEKLIACNKKPSGRIAPDPEIRGSVMIWWRVSHVATSVPPLPLAWLPLAMLFSRFHIQAQRTSGAESQGLSPERERPAFSGTLLPLAYLQAWPEGTETSGWHMTVHFLLSEGPHIRRH